MARHESLNTIRAKIRILEVKAEALARKEKPGIKQLRAVVTKFRLSPADVKVALNGKARRHSRLIGTRIKPKYRNPSNTSETWTGRGRRPLWMVVALKSGKKRDDFLIK